MNTLSDNKWVFSTGNVYVLNSLLHYSGHLLINYALLFWKISFCKRLLFDNENNGHLSSSPYFSIALYAIIIWIFHPKKLPSRTQCKKYDCFYSAKTYDRPCKRELNRLTFPKSQIFTIPIPNDKKYFSESTLT